MKRKTFQKGITLIEILVVSIISVIVMSGVTMIIVQNARLSANFANKSEAYNKLNFISRELELKIKIGARVELLDEKTIIIYDYEGNFMAGYLIDDNDKLRKCDVDGGDLGSFSPLTENCTFAGSKFSNDAARYAFFDLKMNVNDLNGKLKYETTPFTFYSKCRSL